MGAITRPLGFYVSPPRIGRGSAWNRRLSRKLGYSHQSSESGRTDSTAQGWVSAFPSCLPFE